MKSRWPTRTVASLLCVLAIVSFSENANALTDETIFRNLQLDSVRPGARVLGLGGTSIAVVDDPSAAAINPACLVDIRGFEISTELRATDDNGIGASGAVGSDDLTSPAFPYVGFEGSSDASGAGGAGFLGFVMPVDVGDKSAMLALSRSVALHRDSLTDDSTLAFALDDFPVWINPNGPGGVPTVEQYTVVNNSTGGLDADLVHYDLAFAMGLGTDYAFGVTATLARIDATSSVVDRIQDPEGYLERPINPRADEDGDGVPDDVVSLSTIDDSDSDLSWGLGFAYEPRSRYGGEAPWRLGFSYRGGAELELRQNIAVLDPVTQLPGTEQQSFLNTMRIPDRWGVGVAVRPHRSWLIAADVERVEYSDQLEAFDSGRDLLTSGFIDPDVLDQSDPDRTVRFDVDDGTILRIGAEYMLRRGYWAFGFRGGFYHEPDGRVQMTEFNSDSDAINQAFLDTRGVDRDDDHVTAGFSVQTPVGLRLDLGTDIADSTDRFLLSATWRIDRQR